MADIGRDPSHCLLSRTHIPQPYWCVTVEAGKLPFCCHWGWDAGTSTTVAKLCSGKFFGRPEASWERHLQEAAAHTERKSSAEGRSAVLHRGTSHQQHISHWGFVSTVVWEINTWSDTRTLQTAEPLMKLLPDVIGKCNYYAVTAPDHIAPLLIPGAVSLRWRALSSTEPASRLLAAFSSCRHLGRHLGKHLLGFQLCLSWVPQPTSPLGRES